jgi:hypothetical protein
MLPSWWGGLPGPRGTPSSRSLLKGSSACTACGWPRGAWPADLGVRPTIGAEWPQGSELSDIEHTCLPHGFYRGSAEATALGTSITLTGRIPPDSGTSVKLQKSRVRTSPPEW